RFLIPANRFADGPHYVQCARCRHKWLAEGKPEEGTPKHFLPEAVTASVSRVTSYLPKLDISDFIRIYNAIANFIRGLIALVRRVIAWWKHLDPKKQKTLLKVGKIAGTIFLILFFIFDRDSIADRWPWTDKIYDLIHLSANHDHGGEGLAFEQMRSDLHYDGGAMKLTIQGFIHNKSVKVQEIPPILATAIGADGKTIESWQIDPPTANVAPGEDIPFVSTISAPGGTAVNVNLNFLEKTHAAD
ncbi:MAG TPA: hypothetical protein VFR09_02935, partial [Alphaproteobacteria bacterium]|nr:hypothetical protein [Alphaproteobacteria bacterium]